MTDTRRCVCGATLIPTDQLSVIDTDTVHRHGGPCYVDETRTDVVQRARQALDERDHPTRGGHGHVRPRVDGFRARCFW